MSRSDYSRADDASAAAAGHAAAVACLTVPGDLAGRRLDQALAALLPEHSRTRIQQWIEAGRVSIGDAHPAARFILQGGEQVTVDIPAPTPATDAAQDIPLSIVYADDDILVLDKPAGLVVHPGSGNREGTLLNALLHHAPGQALLPRAGIVHRLDKDTSGLMVVSRTERAHAALVRALAAHEVEREYLAVARGNVARAMTIDAPIGRHPVNRTAMAVVERGKPARTHVAVIERFGAATLLRCRLETGRTHQIRVHLAAVGHPIVGDPEYGGRKPAGGVLAFGRQALHATRLALTHPASGERMTFDAPPPADFAALVSALREHAEQA